MDTKFMLLLLINLSTINFLTRICSFKNDISNFNKSLGEKCSVDIKLDLRTYRLLAKCKKYKNSSILGLKEEISCNRINENKDLSNNEKWEKTKNRRSHESSSKHEEVYQLAKKIKSNKFESKKCSHLEKKIFKELDYFDSLKNNRTISDKVYESLVLKKCRLRIFIPAILLLFFAITIILDHTCFYGLIWILIRAVTMFHGSGWYGRLHKFLESSDLNWLFKSQSGEAVLKMVKKSSMEKWEEVKGHIYVESFFGYLVYIVPLLILGVTLILGILYYHKKVIKYQKIKFTKR
ncbi:Plasmodium exported protein (Pm-fam-a like), unknown function [Plasmodium malariae]|uniref:Fam-l protein n=1 Tax=Plasmodium malariae TaxID=5858 RepID=A0A1A8X9G9_PLAMA|nr:Plasmodium exported protein (Pm-fam-a like), unknown function [Plasmodium malariae]